MDLQILGSSSAGNCYLLTNGSETLVLEAGVPLMEVKKAVDFNIRKIVGCCISHEHLDHAKYAIEYMKAGIPVFCSQGTKNRIDNCLYQPTEIFHGKQIKIGNFEIKPFDIIHDAENPFGFLIKHPDCGKGLFLTDTHYSEYSFSGLHFIMVECNYSDRCLSDAILEGRTPAFLRQRIESSHMSLATCKELLSANDLSKVRNIVLIHLSAQNSDPAGFQREVEKMTGINTCVASKGMTVNLSPFLF